MPAVVLRPQALADLADIWAYIAEGSADHADFFLLRADRLFEMLAKKPMMGRARPELAAGIRSFPLGRYVVFYSEGRRGIEVVRVLHGARDLPGMFHPEEE